LKEKRHKDSPGKKKADKINPKTHPLAVAPLKPLQPKEKPTSYRQKFKNKIFTLPLIVEDSGLGLMLENIKKEHLVREGVVRTEGRNTRTNRTQPSPPRFRSVKPAIVKNERLGPDL